MARKHRRWRGWRVSLDGENITSKPRKHGITNDQAKALAALQRAAGERYRAAPG